MENAFTKDGQKSALLAKNMTRKELDKDDTTSYKRTDDTTLHNGFKLFPLIPQILKPIRHIVRYGVLGQPTGIGFGRISVPDNDVSILVYLCSEPVVIVVASARVPGVRRVAKVFDALALALVLDEFCRFRLGQYHFELGVEIIGRWTHYRLNTSEITGLPRGIWTSLISSTIPTVKAS